ncbi:sugar ABC transporter substrate-binding protein [[Clostridium] hylemonae]|uniref:sugar ABC transporter substrate-binding protein n=1 Tax=[Clostridium] hylemonae TaxID=89153 RepID=UPI001FCAACDE|nr:substrate-binding domain-containing protein [[Clostridium] hylemonae]BDF05993.1 sugar ABC transporter substrate-binding protein [[Clostridium] hylemonae]
MKKKVVSVILCVAMIAAMVVGCTTKAPTSGGDDKKDGEKKDSYKIGITIQSLKNDYWAGVMGKLEELLKEKGWDYTLQDCSDNAGTQVSQVENFITSGCDMIMVHPSDADALETVCQQAMDEGIKVMCWDDPMENTTANWILDNTALGNEIGKTASAFINEHYTADKPAEVCVIGKPSTKVLLERANGIKEGLEENCDKGNYKIVAEVDGLEANEAQPNVESVLQAHPDCSVFVGVGAGAMIGSNEALLQKFGGAGKIPENVGVITTDVTMQQLESLQAGDEAVRAIVGFEGSSTDTAKACLDMYERILSGEDFSGDNHNVVRPVKAIDKDSVEEIIKGM